MRKSVFFALFLSLLSVSTAAALEPGDTLWTRTYGTQSGSDYVFCVQQTTDGGYVMAGRYGPLVSGYDAWLIKTDADGDTLWTRRYGGVDEDCAYSVEQTADGGYILAGWTNSFGAGSWDVYVVRTDANGDTLWTRTFGGSSTDRAYYAQETTWGGYIIAGETYSFGAGSYDLYLIRTDQHGNAEFARTYGGTERDHGYCVRQTADDGFIIAGRTESFGAGGSDVYLVKTESHGDTLWTRTYGGGGTDRVGEGRCIQQTDDGGYILGGWTNSFGAGADDVYLIKTDASGGTVWTQVYGGTDYDQAYAAYQLSDGGYIFAGYSISFGPASFDVYVLRTNAGGDTLWTRAYGGANADVGRSVQETTDGSYIVAAYSSTFGPGGYDAWLLKLVGDIEPEVAIEIIPDEPPPFRVPQGGHFGFTGTITNNTEDPQLVDAWVMAVGPEPQGVYWGPFKRFDDLTLAPGQARRAHFNQRVPNLAPLGFYNYIAYCGDYPSTVMDSSYFRFEVAQGDFTEVGRGGWVLTGSFLAGEVLADLPSDFALLGNYPNPFNATTSISFNLAEAAKVSLKVYDITGRLVTTLVEGQMDAGEHVVSWDASGVSSGVYFYKLTAGEYTATKSMNLLK